MAEHTVLLVDQDIALSESVAAALEPYGCRGVPLGDSAAALAYPQVPSLIVLCIDPKRLGWQVCSTLRRHPVLGAVPLVVTSVEATDADFEAHRKLKWHADRYEHKPLDVARLVESVRALLGGLSSAAAEGDGPAYVDEEEIVSIEDQDEDGQRSQPEIRLQADAESDAPIGAPGAPEGDEGGERGALVAGGTLLAPAPPPPLSGRARPPSGPYEVVSDSDFTHTTLSGMEPLDDASGPHGDAEEEAAELRAERDRLLEELRTRPAAVAASPAREVLGLREQIVRRDRELLELREQIDAKERAILANRDQLRESERARREIDERILAVEKELLNVQERAEALGRDKEMATERERGLRGRLEEALKKVERAQTDADAWRARHAADLEATRQSSASAAHERDALRVELDDTQNRFGEENAALAARIETAERHHLEERTTLTARIEEMARSHGEQIAAQGQRHLEEKGALAETHDAERARADRAHAEALAQMRAERDAAQARATAERDAAQARATAERDAVQARATADAEAAARRVHDLEAVAEKRAAEAAAARQELAEARRQATAEVEEARGRLGRLEADNAGLQEQVLRAYHRLKADEQLGARARKALAIALTLLDENRGAAESEKPAS